MNRISLTLGTAGALIGALIGWIMPGLIIGYKMNGSPNTLTELAMSSGIAAALLAIPLFLLGLLLHFIFNRT